VPPASLNYEVVHFRGFFSKLGFSWFFFYLSLISPEQSAKLRWGPFCVLKKTGVRSERARRRRKNQLINKKLKGQKREMVFCLNPSHIV
jgi:hypothetical protein